jgi:putative salt-induced outer membrane protein
MFRFNRLKGMHMTSWKKLGVAAVAGLMVGSVMADPADGQWRGVAGAALNVASGNTSAQNLLLNVALNRLTTQDKISTVGYVNEGTSKVDGKDQTTAGKWGLNGQYDYNLTPQWFGFGKLGFEHDRLVDLSLRTLLGVGVGYHWIQTPKDTFDVYGGLSDVISRYGVEQTIGGDTKKQFSTMGLILGEASSHQLNDTVAFNQKLEYYPGLSGTKADFAKFNAGLSVAMSSTLSLNVGLTEAYNSKPAPGARKLDTAFFTGVSVKLGQ